MRSIKAIAILLMAAGPSLSLGQTVSNEIRGTAPSGASFAEKIRPDRVSYFSIFTGPSIGNGNNPVDEFGNIEKGGLSTWSQVSFGWKLNEDLRLLANPRFVVNHNSVDPGGEEYQWDDPVFGVGGRWYQNGNFSVGGSVNSVAPNLRTEGTEEDGILFNPGGFQSANYILNGRWNIGAWLSARAFIYDRAMTTEDSSFSFMLAPLATYSWSDNLRGTLFYQFKGDGDRESQVSFTRDESFNAMASVAVSRFLTVEPILTVFRESNYDFAKANFTMWLSGRLF